MPSTKLSILYIDDDAAARLMLTLRFGQCGYEVLAASSRQAEQFIVPEESFDLYLLGPRLSEMIATALWRKIRELDAAARIIVSSMTPNKSADEAAMRRAGVIFVSNSFLS